MIFLDTEAMPIPPWTHLLLRFIRLHDQFVPLGVIKSINIVGENTRATMNWETCRGYVYVSDWNLDDNVHPVFMAHHSFPLGKDTGGITYNLNGPEADYPWTIDENTNDFYSWSHSYPLNRTSVIPSISGIYKVNLTARFYFQSKPEECWCGNNWPLPDLDTNVRADANITVDNGLQPGAGPTRGLGYVYAMCSDGGLGNYGVKADARCVSNVSSNQDGILMSLDYTSGGTYFEDSDCIAAGPTIGAVEYNLSIIQLHQN